MDNVITLLVAAIGGLATAVIALWRDGKKARDAHTLAEAKHAIDLQAAITEAATKFAGVVQAITTAHQTQEEKIHADNLARLTDLVREHKTEMAGMVDRVTAAMQNSKEHDDIVIDRVLDLAESIKRIAESTGKTRAPT